jgi:diguanylate cyclase (GGDEF)-like protein
VLFIDLDRFKQINDILGHAMGDRLLKEVGQRLKRLLTEDDLAGRMGGDEFTIVLTRQPDEASRGAGVARISECFSRAAPD